MRKRRLATRGVRVATPAVLHGAPVEAVVGSVAGPAGIAIVAARRLPALVATGAVVARSRAPVVVWVDAIAAAVRLAVLGFLLFDVQLDTVGTVAGEVYGLEV